MPDLGPQGAFCRHAEKCGIDSLLVDFGWSKPDPILLCAALGATSTNIKLILAYRSGLICPTYFVQQLNTLSQLIDGRFSLNIVAGNSPNEQAYYGDFLNHDERYERTEEFLTVCNAFWESGAEVNFRGKHYCVEGGKLNTPFRSPERNSPEIYIAGNSISARRVALSQGTCWMRFPDDPEKLRHEIQPVLDSGKDVGLRFSVIVGPTREEALAAAHGLVKGAEAGFDNLTQEAKFAAASDSYSIRSLWKAASEEWLTDCLWTGAVKSHGPASIALVGSPSEVASAILSYREIGVSQFILSGWPKLESMTYFGREVLALIRAHEKISVSDIGVLSSAEAKTSQ